MRTISLKHAKCSVGLQFPTAPLLNAEFCGGVHCGRQVSDLNRAYNNNPAGTPNEPGIASVRDTDASTGADPAVDRHDCAVCNSISIHASTSESYVGAISPDVRRPRHLKNSSN
jgi:hypothetical protein